MALQYTTDHDVEALIAAMSADEQIELASFAIGWNVACQACGNPGVPFQDIPDIYTDTDLDKGYDAAMSVISIRVIDTVLDSVAESVD